VRRLGGWGGRTSNIGIAVVRAGRSLQELESYVELGTARLFKVRCAAREPWRQRQSSLMGTTDGKKMTAVLRQMFVSAALCFHITTRWIRASRVLCVVTECYVMNSTNCISPPNHRMFMR
jgi:hypothetical protein